jgi:hypothetical protein
LNREMMDFTMKGLGSDDDKIQTTTISRRGKSATNTHLVGKLSKLVRNTKNMIGNQSKLVGNTTQMVGKLKHILDFCNLKKDKLLSYTEILGEKTMTKP